TTSPPCATWCPRSRPYGCRSSRWGSGRSSSPSRSPPSRASSTSTVRSSSARARAGSDPRATWWPTYGASDDQCGSGDQFGVAPLHRGDDPIRVGGPDVGVEDLHLDVAGVPGGGHGGRQRREVDHAVAHHAPPEQYVGGQRREEVADLVRGDLTGRARPGD